MVETLRWTAKRISETPDEVLMFSFSLLMLVGVGLIAYWYYNRRKLHQLSHQIPAIVVKNYLDSIIQNSSALKSSLFRGGGLDVGEGIASVVPVSELPSGSISSQTSSAGAEELNQRLAEIANLTKRLSERETLIKELEEKLQDSSAPASVDQSPEIERLKSEVNKLKQQLDLARSSSSEVGGNEELEQQLNAVTQERDELKDRLLEYEIIEEDLANLKRLQQENEQLKNQLNALKGGDSSDLMDMKTPTESETVEIVEEPVPEEVIEESEPLGVEEEEAPVATEEETFEEETQQLQQEEDKKEKAPSAQEQKSAEELLSEFEKMLG